MHSFIRNLSTLGNEEKKRILNAFLWPTVKKQAAFSPTNQPFNTGPEFSKNPAGKHLPIPSTAKHREYGNAKHDRSNIPHSKIARTCCK